MTLFKALNKVIEKTVFFNHQDIRKKQGPKQKLGDLVRKADNKKSFSSKGDTANWFNKL